MSSEVRVWPVDPVVQCRMCRGFDATVSPYRDGVVMTCIRGALGWYPDVPTALDAAGPHTPVMTIADTRMMGPRPVRRKAKRK